MAHKSESCGFARAQLPLFHRAFAIEHVVQQLRVFLEPLEPSTGLDKASGIPASRDQECTGNKREGWDQPCREDTEGMLAQLLAYLYRQGDCIHLGQVLLDCPVEGAFFCYRR